MSLAKESRSEKQTFTVYAYKPMWCEIEAHSMEEAQQLALKNGQWQGVEEELTEEDIYEVVNDNGDPPKK